MVSVIKLYHQNVLSQRTGSPASVSMAGRSLKWTECTVCKEHFSESTKQSIATVTTSYLSKWHFWGFIANLFGIPQKRRQLRMISLEISWLLWKETWIYFHRIQLDGITIITHQVCVSSEVEGRGWLYPGQKYEQVRRRPKGGQTDRVTVFRRDNRGIE